MGRSIRKEGSSHGAIATGLGMAGNGVVGTSTKFSGDSKSNKVSVDSGSSGYKKVGDVGMKAHKTGGMSRKSAGGVGSFKATGTK